jgi:hypothetical protein
MGLLDILTGNDQGASPWGALFQAPQAPTDEDKAKLAQQAFLQSLMQNPAAGVGNPSLNGAPAGPAATAAPASPFGDPSNLSAVPAPPIPAPSPFASGVAPAPFGFAPSNMASVNPSQIAPPAALGAPPQAPAPVSAPPAPVAPPAAPMPPAVANANAAAPDDPNDPIAVGKYQMPRIGDGFPDDDAPAAPAARTPAAAVPAVPATAPFSLAGNLGAAQKSFDGTSGLIPGIVNAIKGGITGQPVFDARTQAQNATVQALVAKGAPVEDVKAAVNNPALMTALINQYYGRDKYQLVQSADGMGVQRPVGAFSTSEGTLKKFDGADAGGLGAGGLGDMSKTGAAYLATLPPAQAQIIKGMVDGTVQPPSSFALAKPAWQAMLAGAKNLDPLFDETKWSARSVMARSAQGDGKMGQNINALTTGVGHLKQLWDTIPDLNNSDYSQTYNRVGNAISTEFGGTGVTNFESVRDRVAPEIVKIWRGTGGAEADIRRDIESLSSTKTPSQLRGAISNIAGMMQSKLDSNMQEYRATMGKDMPLTPEQQAQMQSIQQLQSMAGGSASGSGSGSGTPAGTVNVGGQSINWKVH